MSKIIKNTTGSIIPIDATGVDIPASGQYIIPPQDYALWAAPETITEITTDVNSGDLVVNDGIQDLPASDGLEFLRFPDKGQMKVTADDQTRGYLKDKFEAGAGVTLQEVNPGANEKLRITATAADPFANALFDGCEPLFDVNENCNVELLTECG